LILAFLRHRTLLALLCLWLLAPAARADDVADEADLQFNLGTERFEA
jgi:hypothetical protein